MDQPASRRPGPHADRTLRLARRRAALPRQPDSRTPAAGLPAPARPAAAGRAAGDRHRRPELCAARRAPRADAAPRCTPGRPGAVRDAGRDQRAAGLCRGLHQARAEQRRSGTHRRRGLGTGADPRRGRRRQAVPDRAPVREPACRCRRRRCFRRQRRPGAVAGAAGAAGGTARPAGRHQHRGAACARWRREPAAGADFDRHRAGDRRPRELRRPRPAHADSGAVGGADARPHAFRERLPHARSARRQRQHGRPDARRHAAHVAAQRVVPLGAVERRAREPGSRRRRHAAAHRRCRARLAARRLAAPAAASRRAGRTPGAVLARHQCRCCRPAGDARRPGARQLDRCRRPDLFAADGLGRPGDAGGRSRGARPRLPALVAGRRPGNDQRRCQRRPRGDGVRTRRRGRHAALR